APMPEGSRATDDKGGAQMISRWMQDDILTRVQNLTQIAAELNLSPAQLAVAWVLQNENVASAIIGASRPEQVKENVVASDVSIPVELMKKIDEVLGDVVLRDPALTLESSPATRAA
ncbi:MAG: aldo/keto reductase, partial [Lacisediminihabitans sp.]